MNSSDTQTDLLMFFSILAAGFGMKDVINRRFRRVAQF